MTVAPERLTPELVLWLMRHLPTTARSASRSRCTARRGWRGLRGRDTDVERFAQRGDGAGVGFGHRDHLATRASRRPGRGRPVKPPPARHAAPGTRAPPGGQSRRRHGLDPAVCQDNVEPARRRGLRPPPAGPRPTPRGRPEPSSRIGRQIITTPRPSAVAVDVRSVRSRRHRVHPDGLPGFASLRPTRPPYHHAQPALEQRRG